MTNTETKKYKDIDLKTGEDILGDKTINVSMANILGTPKYTIPGEPLFGLEAGTPFSQNDAVSKSLLMDSIRAEVSKRDSRITITDSNVEQKENYMTLTLDISIMNERDYSLSVNITNN